jgi:hypothetical protein
MSGTYKVGAYWGPRSETKEACAAWLSRVFEHLGRASSVFEKWYQKGRSRRGALTKPVNVQDPAELVALLERGRNRRDIDNSIIENLGFSLALWNGQEESHVAELSTTCGAWHCFPTMPRSSNNVIVRLPSHLGELSETIRMKELLTAVVLSCRPVFARVFKTELVARLHANIPELSVACWMIYLDDRYYSMASSDVGVEQVKTGDHGQLIIVTSGEPDPSSGEHMAAIERVYSAIRWVNEPSH